MEEVLTRERDVRRKLERLSRDLRLGEKAYLEVREEVVEYAVDEAIRQGLSVVDAYEKDGNIVLIIEKRHG